MRSCWRLHSDIEKYCVLFSVYIRLHQQFKRTNFIELPAPALLQIKYYVLFFASACLHQQFNRIDLIE